MEYVLYTGLTIILLGSGVACCGIIDFMRAEVEDEYLLELLEKIREIEPDLVPTLKVFTTTWK